MSIARPWLVATGILAGSLLVAVGIVTSMCMCCSSFVPGRDDPAREAATETYFEGHDLYDAGRFDEAIDKYDVLRDFLEGDGEDASEVTGLIAHCHDLAGRPDDALRLFDRSLRANPLWHVRVYKAHCLRRHRGLDAAMAWLRDEALEHEERCQVMGRFHLERGAHAAAIPWLSKLLIARGWSDFRYDDKEGIVGLPERIDVQVNNTLAGCSYVLLDLAQSHYGAKNLDEAFRFASMGIAVGQVLHRGKTYLTGEYREAGDIQCRLLRAGVYAARGDLAAARTDIDFAATMANAGSYPPYKLMVREAYGWLDKRESAARSPK